MIMIIYLILAIYTQQIMLKQCSVYPPDVNTCLEQIQNFSCAFDQFTNSCIPHSDTNYGCISNLNQKACISQLSDKEGKEYYCVFEQRCKNVSKFQLSKIGCLAKYSKYACLNIINEKCAWDSSCQKIQTEQSLGLLCEEQFNMSVSPLACSTLQNLECLNTGFNGDYKCTTISEEDKYSTLKCQQLGLTEKACTKIQTFDEKCIYKNQICQPASNDDIVNCNQKINKLACLSIQNPNLRCQWSNSKCQDFQFTNEVLEIVSDVNYNVCIKLEGSYKYVKEKFQCERIPLENHYDLSCNTLGLSRDACLKIKNQNCIFYEGKCQEVNEQDLETYLCNMDLNEMTCLNLRTKFQYCKWNGNKCERIFMNQDINCPLNFEDISIKVNGNVCQAISKLDVLCKYDQKTNLCITSQIDNDCNTPYLNKKGCLSITANKKACQWINQACTSIEIKQYFTTCESLGHANPYACSQVFENNTKGCYYDKIQEKCISINVESEDDNIKQFFEQSNCQDLSLGLNKVACASITTKLTPCGWFKGQCTSKSWNEIKNIPCQNLEYVNYQVCTFVEYAKEKCSYNKKDKKCVGQILDENTCNQPGLNRYACASIKGSCYFYDNICQNVQQNAIELKCTTNSPSKLVCLDIKTDGQFCQWSLRHSRCINLEVIPNQPCIALTNVNRNVCAKILMSYPDFDPENPIETLNRGYCKYNEVDQKCEILQPINESKVVNVNYCQIENHNTTKCCTDIRGINAHSCSRYSSKDPNVYCYFKDFKCQELTNTQVDIYKEEQVKNYFNELKIPCSSLTKNSCHMIEWSQSERCLYDGKICNNFDQQYYPNLIILTQEPYITNKNLCLSLQAKGSHKLKYFIYDDSNKRCKLLTIPQKKCIDGNGKIIDCVAICADTEGLLKVCQTKCLDEQGNTIDCVETCKDEQGNIIECQTKCIDEQGNIINCLKKCVDDNNNTINCHTKCVDEQGTTLACLTKCEDVQGNRNACLRFTEEFYCKWDPYKFKCVTIYEDELYDIKNCDLNTNIKTCNTNKYQGCYFNYDSDVCMKAPLDLTCGDLPGINEIVCKSLTKQPCKYDQDNGNLYKKICAMVTDKQKFECINVFNVNNKACYQYTTNHCRWNQETLTCYENQDEISQLSCEDNINKVLCLKITKEACFWNEDAYQCERFEQISYSQFEKNNSDNLYNKEACFLINEKGYYHDPEKNKCILETKNNLTCSEYKMNKYACLFLTRGSKCYYQDGECKKYTDDQTICNAGKDISIEVCMDIPQTCYFDIASLKCEFAQIDQPTNCQQLFISEFDQPDDSYPDGVSKSNVRRYYNKLSCSSIHEDITTEYGEEQCYQQTAKAQQCNLQKNCYWKIDTYTCNVFKVIESVFDNKHHKQKEINSYIQSDTQEQEYINENHQNCLKQIIDDDKNIDQVQVNKCLNTNQNCTKAADCPVFKNYTESPPDDVDIEKLNEFLDKQNSYNDECFTHCYPFNPDCQQGKLQFINEITKECKNKLFYEYDPICYIVQNRIKDCKNIYSKAICLQIIENDCYFDIQQGGCNQLENNQHKLPSCSAIQRKCYSSYSQKAICKVIEKEPPKNCYQLPMSQQCSNNSDIKVQYCDDIQKVNVSPILCSKAQDDCKFDDKVKICVNTPQDPCECDKSYSKSLCEDCGCDYTFLGYCNKKDDLKYPKLNDDYSNKYYLCYEVNLLGDVNKQDICGSVVEQACRFNNKKCEDATNLLCTNLINFTVSKLACLKCKDLPMQYDESNKKCLQLEENKQLETCENMNYLACIRNTSINCYWTGQNCEKIQNQQALECSDLNYHVCIIERSDLQNLCWFNPLNKLCEKYNPLKGKCEQYMNKQTCNLSMVESCIWNGLICKKLPLESNPNCEGLNKYGCLNAYKPCVWFDDFKKCEQAKFFDQSNLSDEDVSCNEILQNQSDYQYMNAQTCTQINVNKSCILGKNYKCREILEPQFYECEQQGINTLGLNKYACLYKTKNSCAFKDNKCYLMLNVKQGCQGYLNKAACLNQDENCQFSENTCKEISSEQKTNRAIIQSSSQYCKLWDSTQKSFIYSKDLGNCIDITDRNANVPQCGSQGINKYACLTKTLGSCQYINEQCQIKNDEIKSCDDDTLNWVACLSNQKLECKFLEFKCQSIKKDDQCVSLQQQKAIINSFICAKTTDVPCKYDSTTQSCMDITNINKDEMCSALGLNEKACIFHTSNSKCKYSSEQCKMDLEIAKCTDKVNENKCLSLRDQYCYFDQKDGCKGLDFNEFNTQNCTFNSNSNRNITGITCKLATNEPCLYDQQKKSCKIQNSGDSDLSQENLFSFNILACLNIDFINTYWQDGCLEATDEILTKLKCNDQINKKSCLMVKTQSQLCQFQEKKCEPYSQKQDEDCNSIININNGIICSLNTSKACKYDSNQCKESNDNPEDLDCSKKAEQFYNKIACEKRKGCIFIDKCQQLDQNNLYYCSQANSIEHCKNVLLEGCYRNSQQQCSIITSELQKSINCSDVENKVGCIKLKTKGQFCRYYNNKCQNENILDYKNKKCTDINMINTYEFCEYTRDIECIYDPLNNSCIDAKQEIQDLTCPRGLNRLACIPLNSKSLQCQFFNYCYGQNQDILNCNQNSNECCQKALTMESCLFQTKFKCQWNNEKCTSYQANQISCNTIQNASRTVCYSLIDKFCIFDQINLKCQEIVPETCDQVQSEEQCKRIPKIPCYWNKDQDECQYKQMDLSDSCEFINNNHGNYKACIQIQRSGQMCAFFDYQCQSFTEIQYTNNCLDYINQNACLQQTISQCYWDQNVQNNEQNLCKQFDAQQNQFDCQINLSFQSCLNIKKEKTYCQWKDGFCQKISDANINIEKLSTISYVNENTCKLITDVKFQYDNTLYKCLIIKNQSNLCTWNFQKHICINPTNDAKQIQRENDFEQKKISQYTQIELTSKGAQEQPCGIRDGVCDIVDLNVVKCDHEGLNKQACLNIKTQPCIWIKNNKNDFEHCEEKIPEGNCEEQNRNRSVNAVLCSMVQENDPCSYDSSKQKCKKPEENLNYCNVEGINVYGCVQIKNCYFQNQTCKLFDPNQNLSCKDVQFANELVCAQIKNDGCKHNLLEIGCVKSSIFDICSTSGINMNECNSIEQCQWMNGKCQCKKLLELYKDCSEYLDYQNCNNSDKCYFEQSILDKNSGVCKQKHCDYINQCNYELFKGKICYSNLEGQCIEANSCDQIKGFSGDCSEYSFNNIQCVSDGNDGCRQLQNCENLNRTQCGYYSRKCIQLNSCITKQCHHIQDQNQCINFGCTWTNRQCIQQIQCSEILQEKDCNKNKYKGLQCSWFKVTINNSVSEICTSDGCHFLQKNSYCHGTQIGESVCLQSKEMVCLACEQILDVCDCMEKEGYCTYDTQKNQCISQTCQNYNQQNCPKHRCSFYEKKKICIPQCQFQYSKTQCQQFEDCTWDGDLTPPCIEILIQDVIIDPVVSDFSVALLIPFFILLLF